MSSEQELQQQQQQPQHNSEPEPQAPETATDSVIEKSQSERIIEELLKEIESGADLAIKHEKVAACHRVEERLNVPYVNVTKQVQKALKIWAQKQGRNPPPESQKKAAASNATVTVETGEDGAGADEPASQVTTPASPAATEPEEIDMSAEFRRIYRSCKSLDELRATTEYKFIKGYLDMGAGMVAGMYKRINVDPYEFVPEDQMETLKDFTAQMSMKYGWKIDERIEKAVLVAGWGSFAVLPIVAWLAGKRKEAKKPDPAKTNEKLAEVNTI